MAVSHCRPAVNELIFQLHARPLHPEFFDILAVRKIAREDYHLTVWITRTGHVVTWENPDVILTEVATSQQGELPERRRLMHFKLRSEQSKKLTCAHGITYQMSFQVEVMEPEIFFHVHDEILADGSKRGFLHNFNANDRLNLAPLGFLSAEARPGLLIVTSFHTFPDEYTVVKTQSLIERER